MVPRWSRRSVLLSFVFFVQVATLSKEKTEAVVQDDSSTAATSSIYDLDSAIRKYVEKMVLSFQAKNGRKDFMSAPLFSTKGITIDYGVMQYGKPSKSSLKATYVYTHWFHNKGKIAVNSGLRQKSIACAGIFTWTVKRGVQLKEHDFTVRADIPGMFKNMADFGINLSKSAAQSSSQPLRASFSAHKFYMRPKTSSKVEFHIPVRVIHIPWKIPIYLDGWFTVQLSKSLHGSKTWKYPVWWLHSKILTIAKPSASGGHRLAFTAWGRLSAIWFPDLQEIHSPDLAYQPNMNDTFWLFRTNRTKPEDDSMGLCVPQ